MTTVLTECGGYPVRAPNDLVFDADGGIWFTDHGVREERTSDRTGIHYSRPDGSEACVAVFPLDAPSGIGLSPAGDRLYVAGDPHRAPLGVGRHRPRRGDRLRRGARGAELLANPGGGAFFDSLAVDGDGWICVATLGAAGDHGLLTRRQEAEYTPLPDPLTTNICFAPEGHRLRHALGHRPARRLRLAPRAGACHSRRDGGTPIRPTSGRSRKFGGETPR